MPHFDTLLYTLVIKTIKSTNCLLHMSEQIVYMSERLLRHTRYKHSLTPIMELYGMSGVRETTPQSFKNHM